MNSNSHPAFELIDYAIASGASGTPAAFDEWQEASRAALRVAFGEGDSMIDRFDGISYSPAIQNFPESNSDVAQRSGVQKGIAILRAARKILEASAGGGPDLSVLPESFHPWVSTLVGPLWDQGMFRPAVEEAARTIEVQLKAKLGISDGTGNNLITEAFSPKDPVDGHPRLRFPGFDAGTSDWTNAHEGAMFLGRGCMMRIRNLYTHGHEPDPAEAFEAIAALSLLARWIDSAHVQTVSSS